MYEEMFLVYVNVCNSMTNGNFGERYLRSALFYGMIFNGTLGFLRKNEDYGLNWTKLHTNAKQLFD